MAEKDYTAIAKQRLTDEAARLAEQRITGLAEQLRIADERQQQLAALRAKHGLHDAATLREIADAEIAYGHAWGSHIGCKYASARACELLSPESIQPYDGMSPEQRARVEKHRADTIALRDMERARFEESYAKEATARRAAVSGQVVDSAVQSRAHNTVAA